MLTALGRRKMKHEEEVLADVYTMVWQNLSRPTPSNTPLPLPRLPTQ